MAEEQKQIFRQASLDRIVVAHRLSTIRQCDRIIVLDGGASLRTALTTN